MEDEWLRYSCQLSLPGFGRDNQLKLQNASVLLVGAGGLGCPAAIYLAASGVGKIGIADFDIISVSNLHRQVLYSPHETGLPKAEIACKKLRLQNPQIEILAITEKITAKNVMELLAAYAVVIDATDNFDTKYLLNDACVLAGKPLVFGAIFQYEGQVSLLNVRNPDGSYSPNYRDLFPDVNSAQIPNCAEGGVLPTIAGIIGCIQANEVIKYITGTGELLSGKVLLVDASTLETRIIKTGYAAKTKITKLPEEDKIELISAAELKKGIVNGRYELIDVRNLDERLEFHIGGKHIPLAVIGGKLGMIDFDKPVVFYCASGRRSAEALKTVRKSFPGNSFFSLSGGIKAWKEMEMTINN